MLSFLNEGMSNSMLEAMASGHAIIATDTGGTKELVDGSNIILKASSTPIRITILNQLYFPGYIIPIFLYSTWPV